MSAIRTAALVAIVTILLMAGSRVAHAGHGDSPYQIAGSSGFFASATKTAFQTSGCDPATLTAIQGIDAAVIDVSHFATGPGAVTVGQVTPVPRTLGASVSFLTGACTAPIGRPNHLQAEASLTYRLQPEIRWLVFAPNVNVLTSVTAANPVPGEPWV